MPVYNKLVRDNILEIIKKDGLNYKARILEQEEYLKELKKKFKEEVNEIVETKTEEETMEEMADLLELIHAMLEAQNKTMNELEDIRLQKKEKRGGFNKRIFLIDVEDE